jgi:hypothetical protein
MLNVIIFYRWKLSPRISATLKGLLDPFLRSHFQVAFWRKIFVENHQQALILPRMMPCQCTKYIAYAASIARISSAAKKQKQI